MSITTINVDIEAGTTHEFQRRLTGALQGEMFVVSVGRQAGKSYMTKILKNNFFGKSTDGPIMRTDPKYKFSRTNWYEAELYGNSRDRLATEYIELIGWCTEHFGPHPANPDAWSRWRVGIGCIYFRDAQDYEWYMLRWA
jgi:hypothetical protein